MESTSLPRRRLAAMESAGPDRWLLAFAISVFVFHQLPAFAGTPAGDAIDVLTPFVVIGTSAGVILALGAPRVAVIVALVAGVLYAHGTGIHLAANSIHNEDPTGSALDVAYFWDERFSHVESLLGWFGLVASFCLAEAQAVGRDAPGRVSRVTVAVLGWTFFTSTVEGQTWPLELVTAAAFGWWALRSRREASSPRPLLDTCACAFALGAILIGVWAVWHGGVPEFSDTGFI